MADALAPPPKSIELEDPGAHELAGSSDGEDHFSDASEGHDAVPPRSNATSPIPMTRVEKVDDKPSYGEVPGTAAYDMRIQDAVPDELEIVPEGQRSRSASRLTRDGRSYTIGGTPIPKLVVEKVDPDTQSHGEVPGTEAYDKRRFDAAPDVVVKAPEETRQTLEGLPTFPQNRYSIPSRARRKSSGDQTEVSAFEENGGLEPTGDAKDDPIRDDFAEFAEGGEEDDFGDFDDGFQQPEEEHVADFDVEKPPDTNPIEVGRRSLPILDFSKFEALDEVLEATQPYINELFPNLLSTTASPSEPLPEANSVFITDRSLSLWSQLVAPPPLQPPNWKRSRIRRLFLVSLGVPVDLDEILPASKQKKLVLPSIKVSGDHSPRLGAEAENSVTVGVRQENGSAATLQSSAPKSERSRRGPPPPPDFDEASTRILCSTTEAAMDNFSDEELQAHIQALNEANSRASNVLEYWLKRKDNAMGDKEAFEGVIENLVKHAKKVRK